MTKQTTDKTGISDKKKAYLREYYKKRLKAKRQTERKAKAQEPKQERTIEVVCQGCGAIIQAKNKSKKFCDECLRLKRIEYNKKPEVRAKLRQQAKDRYNADPERYKEYHRNWLQSSEEHKEKHSEAVRRNYLRRKNEKNNG